MKIIYLLHQLLVLCRAGVSDLPKSHCFFCGYFRLLRKEGRGGDTTSVFVVFISLTVIIFKLFLVEYLIEIHAWSFAKLHSWFSDVIVRISSFRLGSIDDSRSFVRPSVGPSIHCICPQLQGKSIMISTSSFFAPIVSEPNKKRLLLLVGEIVVKQLLLMTRIIISLQNFIWFLFRFVVFWEG